MPRHARDKLRSGFGNEHAVKARAGELDAYDQFAVASARFQGATGMLISIFMPRSMA
jgi:hypothetical protein